MRSVADKVAVCDLQSAMRKSAKGRCAQNFRLLALQYGSACLSSQKRKQSGAGLCLQRRTAHRRSAGSSWLSDSARLVGTQLHFRPKKFAQKQQIAGFGGGRSERSSLQMQNGRSLSRSKKENSDYLLQSAVQRRMATLVVGQAQNSQTFQQNQHLLPPPNLCWLWRIYRQKTRDYRKKFAGRIKALSFLDPKQVKVIRYWSSL